MVEFEAEFQGMDDAMWWLDPSLEISESQANGGSLSNSERIDDWFRLLPSSGDPNSLDQPFETNSEQIWAFSPPDFQPSNFLSDSLHSSTLVSTTAQNFPAPGYALRGDLPYDGYHNIGSFSAAGSSTMSEAFSPSSSEHLYSSFPASPMTLFGTFQQPSNPIPSPLNLQIGFNTAASLPLREFGNMPGLLSPVRPPHRRGRKGNRPVGHPRISARELRKAQRDETCKFCGWGFPYKADLRKHIVAKHTPEPNKDKYHCKECTKVYTRSDHLYRHGVAKHGWPPGGDRRRSQGRG